MLTGTSLLKRRKTAKRAPKTSTPTSTSERLKEERSSLAGFYGTWVETKIERDGKPAEPPTRAATPIIGGKETSAEMAALAGKYLNTTTQDVADMTLSEIAALLRRLSASLLSQTPLTAGEVQQRSEEHRDR